MTDPWKDLAAPDQPTKISARRVDERIRWNFFWAKGADRKCLLVLKHQPGSRPSSKLPTLNGLELAETDGDDDTSLMLIFKLADTNQRGIFQQLCLDIVVATGPAETEAEAVELALARTWRWHHLLRGGSNGLLSSEEQKGVIGELLFFEEYLLRLFSPADSVEAWLGPLDAPKDFEVGRVCIEAKARRGGAKPFIAISSEHQLDASQLEALFLYVVNLGGATTNDANAFTLTDVARRVKARIETVDQGAVEMFESRLLANGFDWQQDYSAHRWVSGPAMQFRVDGGFPRLTGSDVPSGVSNVRYSISLIDCEPHVVTPAEIDAALTGAADAN